MGYTPHEDLGYLIAYAVQHFEEGSPFAVLEDIRAAKDVSEKCGLKLHPRLVELRASAYQMILLDRFYMLSFMYDCPENIDDSDVCHMFYLLKDAAKKAKRYVEVPDSLLEMQLNFKSILPMSSDVVYTELVRRPIEDMMGFVRAESWFMKQIWYDTFMEKLKIDLDELDGP